ncbi:hypothetical protein BJV74DRAFT_953171 [Russula compacta]|nr:hypothetical protein BJV74DRAFT_953171 [Russula compacta]
MTSLPPTLTHTASIPDLVGDHHNLAKDEKTGKEVHVYAISGPPVFGSAPSASAAAGRHNFNTQWNYFGVTWILNGYVDLSTLKIDATFSVHIPIIGTHQIAGVNGNLKEGVKVSFALNHVLSGSAKFYLKNKWLYLDLDAKVFGHNESISFHLIPLPI